MSVEQRKPGGVGELLGYVRVSTADQSPEGQTDALRSAGVERIWTDVASGVRAHRPALAELVEASAAGDVVVVVCRLDRLGRSLPELRPERPHLGVCRGRRRCGR
jgi:DNA invertase Pin-like site-specific DNA recombinase